MKVLIVFMISISLFYSCNMISAGTHGFIKSYVYPVSKNVLEKSVNKLIESDSTILHDEFGNDHYNDGKTYFRIAINDSGKQYRYTMQYSIENSDSPSSSDISIVYLYDENGNALNESNSTLEKSIFIKLTDVLERNFIKKIDKQLGLNHKEIDNFMEK